MIDLLFLVSLSGKRMAFERRIQATVLGPGPPGHLKVTLGRGKGEFVSEVSADLLPASLRMPNSQFVAVVKGRELLRVETEGRPWLVIQDRIRTVLNAEWDPIGVADAVEDEYDMYIGHIYSLIRTGVSEQAIAEHLSQIEHERMGLSPAPIDRLLPVASHLRALQLPALKEP
jgi:hypothetical protein